MRKYLLKIGIIGTLIFLGFFVYFYATSGKFRQSIISAFVAVGVFLASLQPAYSAGEADGFTPQTQQHRSRPASGRGIFNSNNEGSSSGLGKPDDFGSDSDRDGLPQFPQTESIEETKEHLSIIDKQINKLEEVTDSDSESECEVTNNLKNKYKKLKEELPDSSKFIYDITTKTAKAALEQVGKNSAARKEVLAGLDKMDKGLLLPRNFKDFKGFKSLKEIKLRNTRMLVQPGKNDDPDVIVAIFMRRDLEDVTASLKGKYK